MNLQLGDTAWHLSVFDMATCDAEEFITPLAGETEQHTHRYATFSSAVYRLSHHTALQTHSIYCCYQSYQPGLLLAEVCLQLCVCVCARVVFSVLCVLMREIFLAICAFFIHCICIYVHICVLPCESISESVKVSHFL